MVAAIEAFFEKFCKDILNRKAYTTQVADDKIVFFEPFVETAESAGSFDGWCPKELSLLSRTVCGKVAIMLNQIEDGTPWPGSATHARVVYLGRGCNR